MTTKNELLANKKRYMSLRAKIWKQLSYSPSLFLNDEELKAYETKKAELLQEIDFCNDILKSLSLQL